MPRLGFQHIAWSKTQPALHPFDLADSAVAAPDLAALALPDRGALHPDGQRDRNAALEIALGGRISAPAGRVLVTAGASEANACVYAGLLSPGDEVLVERPGYEPHRDLAGLFGLGIATFARRRQAGFAGFAEELEAAVRPATRMVVVSHLHNPSGLPLDAGDVEALDRLAERRGLWVLCDETFRDAADLPLGTLASRGPRWISTSSLTKVYGLGGLRIGWVAGGRQALERCATAQNGLSANPAAPSVALALALTPHLDSLRDRARRLLAGNRASWSACAGRVAGRGAFDPGEPSRGTTAWCRFPAEGRGDSFAAYASARFGLAVTPGRFFGDPRGIRIGLGAVPARFGPALDRLETALASFAGAETPTGARA